MGGGRGFLGVVAMKFARILTRQGEVGWADPCCCQHRWPRGGFCQDTQEMGNIWFLGARVLDVPASEETATAREGYFAGIEDRGTLVGFHGLRRFGNETSKDAGCRGWAFCPLVCTVVLPCTMFLTLDFFPIWLFLYKFLAYIPLCHELLIFSVPGFFFIFWT